MSRRVILVGLLCSLFASATFSAHAKDACESVLCLYGKATGNSGGSDCKSAEKDFFNIVKKNKHGFLPNHTLDARKSFLNQCESADPKYISEILSKFGKVRV